MIVKKNYLSEEMMTLLNDSENKIEPATFAKIKALCAKMVARDDEITNLTGYATEMGEALCRLNKALSISGYAGTDESYGIMHKALDNIETLMYSGEATLADAKANNP